MPAVHTRNAYQVYRNLGRDNRGGIGIQACRQWTDIEAETLDVGWWYGAMEHGSRFQNEFLRRLFAVLWHGGLYYRPAAGSWRPWSNCDMPIATALSRSGGVVIQYDEDANQDLWQWLWHGQPVQSRGAATHGMQFGNYGLMPNGRRKNWKENKKNDGGHFGFQLAGGGLGNHNVISGNPIREDGRHGHLYLCHRQATNAQPGAILVKAESSAPLDQVASSLSLFSRSPAMRTNADEYNARGLISTATTPIWIGPWLGIAILDLAAGGGWARQPLSIGVGMICPQAQTGDYHAFGVSGERGVTGGKKFKKMYQLNENCPYGDSGYDVMFVNPDRATWQELRDGARAFDPNDLGAIPPIPAPAAQDNAAERINAILVGYLNDLITKYEKESRKYVWRKSSPESQRVVTWFRQVTANNARNLLVNNQPENNISYLYATVETYAENTLRGALVDGAPRVRLTENGRLHKMIKEVHEKIQPIAHNITYRDR